MRQWLSEQSFSFTDEEMTYAELKSAVVKDWPDFSVVGGSEKIVAGELKLRGKDEVYEFNRDASVTIRRTINTGVPRYEVIKKEDQDVS